MLLEGYGETLLSRNARRRDGRRAAYRPERTRNHRSSRRNSGYDAGSTVDGGNGVGCATPEDSLAEGLCSAVIKVAGCAHLDGFTLLNRRSWADGYAGQRRIDKKAPASQRQGKHRKRRKCKQELNSPRGIRPHERPRRA